MFWQTLDDQKAKSMINAVKSIGLGGLFTPTTTEARMCVLPFYRQTCLFRLTNYATLPAFSLFYLGYQNSYHYLDGAYEVIQRYNTRENLILNEQTIIPYLDFYFVFVKLDAGEIGLIGARNQYHFLENHEVSAEITFDATRRVYMVTLPLDFDGSIIDATVEITETGDVAIKETKMSIKGIQENIDYDSTSEY